MRLGPMVGSENTAAKKKMAGVPAPRSRRRTDESSTAKNGKKNEAAETCVGALLQQEALLLEQIEYWRARGSKEAELRQSREAELHEQEKLMKSEFGRIQEEQEAYQVLLDAVYEAQNEIDAQVSALQDEQKQADSIGKLWKAELRVATKKALQVRENVKACHRRLQEGGDVGKVDLRSLFESDADLFRAKIALEFQLQLQEVPISKVLRTVDEIAVTETAERERNPAALICTITTVLRAAKKWKRQTFGVKADEARITLKGSRSKQREMKNEAGDVHALATSYIVDKSYEDAMRQLAAIGIHM